VTVTLLGGLALAALGWGTMFGLGRPGFWRRAAAAGLAIGAYAVTVQRRSIAELLRPTLADVALGVAGAAVLYGVFWAGNAVLRRRLPGVAAQIDDLYTVRSAACAGERLPIPVVLVVVGTCEELFWRGLVQARAGFLVALACYAAVHLWERNAVLVLAAVTGGAFWGALFAWRATLVAPIVSHALWDLAVVVWFPFAEVALPWHSSEGPEGNPTL